MSTVGLIVNPSAARDVRRLTSLARTIDFPERVNLVARILAGLHAGGAAEIWYMPVTEGVIERAVEALAAIPGGDRGAVPRVRRVDLPGDGLARDANGTALAALAMAAAGVDCLITVGGDGTNRAVATGWPDAVLLPLPGGTNNAFATAVDPTAAGLAAARYAAHPERFARFVRRRPRLLVTADGAASRVALVDVAVVEGGWIGARAVWDPALLVEAVTTRSDPSLTGLAGAAGAIRPLEGTDTGALHVRFDPDGPRVLAPLGPGQLVPIGVGGWEMIEPGQPVSLPGANGRERGPLTVALDGEREIALEPGAVARVELSLDGPSVLDAAGLLRAAAQDGGLIPRPGLAAAGARR